MKIKHKSFPMKIEIKEDGANRSIEGWASTFGNKDSYDDIIVPGAFSDTLKDRIPKMLWQHDSSQPCGVWDSATETATGLYVKGRILDTTLGNDVYKLAQAGAIDSMSIGYSTIDASTDYDSGIRTLKKLDLWEVSLVTFPANDQARVTMVKAAMEDIDAAGDLLGQAMALCEAYTAGGMEPTPEVFSMVMQMMGQAQSLLEEPDAEDADTGKSTKLSAKQIERLLREAGMTRGDARGVIAKGYTAIVAPREADGQELNTLCNLFNQFN
jgi:HK97 family phage prohead protease